MCASPVVPSPSSAEPELTTVSKLNTGATWRSTTMNLSPFGRLNDCTCFSRFSSPVRTAAGAPSASFATDVEGFAALARGSVLAGVAPGAVSGRAPRAPAAAGISSAPHSSQAAVRTSRGNGRG